MKLWSLLLPFKWFIIGVGEVLSGIFYLFKRTVSLIGSLFKYLFRFIIVIIRSIGFFVVDIVFKHIFLAIKWLVLKIAVFFLFIFRGLKTIFLGLVKIVKIMLVNTFRGLATVLEWLWLVFKYIIKYIYLAIKMLVIYIVKIIKFIVINLGKILKFIFVNLGKALKFVFVNLWKSLKIIFVYLGRTLKFIFITILYNGLKEMFTFIFKGLAIIFKYIIKIPLFILQGFKILGLGLYKIFIYPFVYLYNNFGRIIVDTINKTKEKIRQGFKYTIDLPKKIIESTKNWFYNLSFMKDIRNRREMKRQALLIDFDAEDAIRSEKKVNYTYVAKNIDGKIEKGRLGAFSKLDVHSYLLAEGYEVYEIEPAKGLNISIGPGVARLNTSELVFLLTQLSTYIKSGIPLVDSIKILSKQSKKSGVKALYKSIVYDLTMGDSFSEALEKQGSSFPKLLVNMIKSAELAGNLSETLDDMADYYSSVSKTKKQMRAAMTYPSVILVFALSVIVFILTFVIPSFIEMYKNADAEVPALTTAIIKLSDFLVGNAIFLIMGVAFVIIGLYFMYKNVKVFRMMVQWMMMHTPILGKIIIYNEVTMFSKTFASLWNHNVFITSSMEILSKITNNEIYKMLIFDAITNVARGEAVSTSFKDHWAFPVVAYEMLITGERTGQPGPMMEKVADYYQEEHRNAVNQVKAFIEPALIVVLAVVVGVILLSVVLPMFNIYGELGLE